MVEVKVDGNVFVVKDDEKGIDAIYDGGSLSGKGSRKFKEDILDEVEHYKKFKKTIDDELDLSPKHEEETIALFSVVNNYGRSTDSYTDIDIERLYQYQLHPIKYNKNLRDMSRYFYNQKGILSETYDLFKSLPTLYSYTDSNDKEYEGYEDDRAIVDVFNEKFDKPQIRDLLFQIAQDGTVITYRRGGKKNPYLQFLDLDYYYPARIRNGNWEVECDLTQFIDGTAQGKSLMKTPINFNNLKPENIVPNSELKDQPLEVQRAFERWRMGQAETENPFPYLFTLNMNRTYVIKNKSRQQDKYGVPYGTAVFEDMIHKDLMKLAERAVVDKIINQLVYVRLGEEGKEGYHPTEPQAKKVFNNVKSLFNSSNRDGIKLVGLPYWATIESLKIDYGIFDKTKYEQIDIDILAGLGISSIISTGQNGNFAQSKIGISVFFAKIFSVLEQVEQMFAHYYGTLVSNKDAKFRRNFPRTFELDDAKKQEVYESIKDIGGAVKPLFDMVGVDFDEYISGVDYEQRVYALRDLFKPYQTSYTMTQDGGAPQGDNPEENQDGNSQPRPSTEGGELET